jgi:superfamily II DNA/RNA helicase
MVASNKIWTAFVLATALVTTSDGFARWKVTRFPCQAIDSEFRFFAETKARPCRRRAELNLRVDSDRSVSISSTILQGASVDCLDDSTLTDESFADRYGDVLPAWITQKCNELGWMYPTVIQQRALDTLLRNHSDVVIQAQTGSGKTLAFLLPVLAGIDPTRSTIQGLIVVPTRELGLQIARLTRRIAASSIVATKPSVVGSSEHAEHSKKIMIMNVLQGSMNRRQRAWAWADPPHVVIGTPEELCNMVKFGGMKRYNSVRYVVVDEVDACLLNNAGSYSANLASSTLHELLAKHLSPSYDDGSFVMDADNAFAKSETPLELGSGGRPLFKERRTIFCSATIPQPRHFLKQCTSNQWTLREPVHVYIRKGEQHLPPTLVHSYMVCRSPDDKLPALQRILRKMMTRSLEESRREDGTGSDTERKVLVFADARRPVEDYAAVLGGNLPRSILQDSASRRKIVQGADAVISILRFDDSLSSRANAIDTFRGESELLTGDDTSEPAQVELLDQNAFVRPRLRVLFATDLAARGLDIPDITHVVHLDLPPDADTYVHRAGRTGRFGRKGQVLSIITEDQEFVLERITNKLGIFDTTCLARQTTS